VGLATSDGNNLTFCDEAGRVPMESEGVAAKSRSVGLDPRAEYLPFVDGLRAVAILAVVGCHIGLPGFSGGYVGVDVFFVISGFLIINQIKDGLEAGRFSIMSFYARRALRILPPFLIMFFTVILICARAISISTQKKSRCCTLGRCRSKNSSIY
jgi:peptidoglycan/LPS O-acetylase OafA/YrhL